MAPLAATVAATLALSVGLTLARSRQQRSKRRRSQERKLGLAPGESVAAALRRMALAQTDLAIELLDCEPSAAPDEQAIHETRKAIKRLRALLRLLEGELGPDVYARENAALRDVARRLSQARDAEVMLATLDALLERHPRKLERRRGVARLRRGLAAQRDEARRQALGDPAARAEVVGELHAFRWRVSGWRLRERPGMALVEADLERVYRRGRRRYRRARDGRGERMTTMHEWRKRVKDLRHALEMLDRRGGGRELRKLAARADALGELLGEDHDLAVMAERLRAGRHVRRGETWRVGRGTRRALLKAIRARRRKLRRRALRLGAQLYERPPRRFVRQVRAAHRRDAKLS